jgi:hypothetical protein
MSQQTLQTLQTIIDGIEHPCCIKENNIIILKNKQYSSGNYNLDEVLNNKSYYLEEKIITKNLKMYEIKLNEINKMSECRQKITQALALL